ncbi:MAG: acyltransferase, partial [Candidatus Methylomirabilis sp.]|nr:acyltransferase [Deltaproteobacteria bacterium]
PEVRRALLILRIRAIALLFGAKVDLHVGRDLQLGKELEILIVPKAKVKLWIGDGVLIDRRVSMLFGDGADVFIDDRCEFRQESILKFNGKFRMEGPSGFAQRCVVHNTHDISIGRYVVITEYTSLTDFIYTVASSNEKANWYYDGEKQFGAIRIGNNVWIGGRCTIAKGVTIGEGAMIAANSLITKDVKPHHMAVGVPARQFPMGEDAEAAEKLRRKAEAKPAAAE